jgi:23S rRNA (adenine2503-C2)-methyltransferase
MIVKEYKNKIVLKGMSLDEIKQWCKTQGQSAFRAQQIYQWMYRHGITESKDMENLSKDFRKTIDKLCILETLKIEKINKSKSEPTQKILFSTIDNQFIEAVSMLEGNRHTICISSQIGCNVDCDFCATASMGLIRNLLTGEIIDQAIAIRKLVKEPITNVVFMGMGEPFLNYDRVLNTAHILHNHQGFELGAKRITISTAGIVPKIERLMKDGYKYKLAISLNATEDDTRQKIMPLNRNWPIQKVIKSASQFAARKGHNIMFEYVLLKDINDTVDDAIRLAKLVQGIDCKVNIIPYNETDGKYKRPSIETIEEFLNILNKHRKGFRVLVRWSKGEDIQAACGQLAVNNP